MEIEVEGGNVVEVEEGGVVNLRALGTLELLTQDEEPSRTTLVDSHNGFNKLILLEMLWTVQSNWPAGARFAFNCYMHWAQLLLRQPGERLVTILSREAVTQVDPLSMVLYGITLNPIAEEIRAAELGLLLTFYADDAAFEGLLRQSAQLLKLLMKRGLDRVYLHKPYKPLFISDTPGKEEAKRREFAVEGLVLNFVSGSTYLGAYLGPQEELEAWVKPQVEAWAHGVGGLGKIS